MAATDLLIQKASLVQGFALFSGVSPAECTGILSTARDRRYTRGQIIFAEGDPARQMVLLLTGCAKITQISLNGDEVILRLNGPGEIVGAFRACSRCNHCSTAQAIQPSTALVWDGTNFEAILDRYPTFHRNVTRILEQRLQEIEQRFREVSTEKVGSRLSSELIRLSKQVGRDTGGHVEIGLSRAELAQMTGTTLFTVSRLLCQWKTLGIVKLRREGVLVRNLEALNQISQRE